MSQNIETTRKSYTKAQIKEMRRSILSDKNKTIKQIAAHFAEKYNRSQQGVEQKIYALFKHSRKRTVKNPKVTAPVVETVEVKEQPIVSTAPVSYSMNIALPNGGTYTGTATKVEMQEDHIRIYF